MSPPLSSRKSARTSSRRIRSSSSPDSALPRLVSFCFCFLSRSFLHTSHSSSIFDSFTLWFRFALHKHCLFIPLHCSISLSFALFQGYPLVFVFLSFDSLLSSFPLFFCLRSFEPVPYPYTSYTLSFLTHVCKRFLERDLVLASTTRGDGRKRRVVVFFPLRDSRLPSWLFQWLED